ncbi:hypothetical protein CQW23_31906 [Capsicum baccatum]|uniref:Uncharacterized protein n=1 Tax=Capsicum baccatum TaxID=33114 RepID=A0A2G2V6B1_CAPBA|nr:hypothetical protein CQW23_31906 [Capsicum baccatum]
MITSVLFADCGGLEEIDLQATKMHEFECFFNNRVRFYFSSIPMLEHVKISLRGDASMPYIFGEFAANLPAQVKSLIVTTWNTQGYGMMVEDNSNELASPVTSVNNDSMDKDNTE